MDCDAVMLAELDTDAELLGVWELVTEPLADTDGVCVLEDVCSARGATREPKG
jgi:hypothetical protein